MKDIITDDFELFTFFQVTPDLVCIVGKDGFLKKVNPSVIDKLEYTAQELYASPVFTFIHTEDIAITAKNREALLEGKALLNFVNRYITKSGNIVWLEWTSIYFADKEVVFAIAKDVTERKKIELVVEEEYKKIKSLAKHFKSNIEKERKYLAFELHEEMAQLVSTVKLDIDWIAHNVPSLPDITRARIEHALAVSGLLIKSIQRLSFSMSPKMLLDFGLTETLDWLCKEFTILNNIPCEFVSDYDEQLLTDEMKLDLFRICQEALTNIIEHANAHKVLVSIKTRQDSIELNITDDGNGFDIDQEKEKVGLIIMEERAVSINGRLFVKSKAGEGTTVSVVIENKNQLSFTA